MNKIALIYMGGTFGCVGEPLAPMPYAQFKTQLQRTIPLEFNVDCFSAPVIKDSSACSAADWLVLIQQIQALQLQGYIHFVVIHGTDTLSYAAATLARFLGQSGHLVVTGSQYPLLNKTGTDTREFTDALDNLYYALDQVVKLPAGSYLAFHHQIFHAQTVLKTHTTELDAFTGILANHDCRTVVPSYLINDEDLLRSEDLSILNVMAQPIGLDAFKQQLQNLLPLPPHFLILQGFGTGNLAVDEDIIALLQQLRQVGCLTILTTQVCFGQIDQRYAVSEWIHTAKILINNTHSHADLYAKALQLYLQFDSPELREQHWALS
ncbi:MULTISPECIES: asparaginase domain-containing protein [unclassified Acinetobacter]|uniref:asparaginase domain-containing protein n=1 Tax=unclassified Acinetobacter TaxID=196816 RepID=UPI001909060E|nr:MULTISPECIES: asparaginase domain-containing protein [unclassified Acinetobacter]MBK0062723.1 asparaginase [Acinetobacter sp. S55]MBK0065700.1 asparaginase [Acinetobacter sp. S54]